MLPGDRLVCAFVEPQQVGATFAKWLLHVTIVPWFRLPDDSAQIEKGLISALVTLEPFEATGSDRALFGPRKNRPATLIADARPFETIEQKVRTYLHKKRAWLVDETTHRPRRFCPHITDQNDYRVSSGTVFTVDRLYIVKQKGDYKQIVNEVKLGQKTA